MSSIQTTYFDAPLFDSVYESYTEAQDCFFAVQPAHL